MIIKSIKKTSSLLAPVMPFDYRWVHMDKYCDWEWVSSTEGVVQTGCTMLGVDLVGNYSSQECGIQLTVGPQHRGVWLCEMEKYHAGFGRR